MSTVPDLWALCGGSEAVAPLVVRRAVRVVESQRQVATLTLTGNVAEQQVLEELLEATKPPLPPEAAGRHYLIATPFRYPPLRHGSRFGRRHQRGLFYCARQLLTALAETAYYRFRFWHDMEIPPPGGRLMSEHTSFEITVNTPRGVRLEAGCFAAHRDLIAHPGDYRATQALGDDLREAGVQASSYPSARRRGGINVVAFTPAAISAGPRRFATWTCRTDESAVEFLRTTDVPRAHRFELQEFLVDGALPRPGAAGTLL